MRIYRYWQKGVFRGIDAAGKPADFEAWGWSNRSLEAASQLGAKRAKGIFLHQLANGGSFQPSKSQEYEYNLSVPPREELIRALDTEPATAPDGETEHQAMITRLRYGSLVLNISYALFADIDLPEPKPLGFGSSLAHLLSPKTRKKRAFEPQERVINRLVEWSAQNAQHGFRLYRTRAGFRLLFTSGRFDPLAAETERILREVGSDPLYRQLTRRQACFRARLTPKCWRLGLRPHSPTFPRPAESEAGFAQWLAAYERLCADHGTCAFIQTFGPSGFADSELETVALLHDEYTKAHEDLPLA